MSKHKSTDYKLTAVKYYLKGKKSSLDEVCMIDDNYSEHASLLYQEDIRV